MTATPECRKLQKMKRFHRLWNTWKLQLYFVEIAFEFFDDFYKYWYQKCKLANEWLLCRAPAQRLLCEWGGCMTTGTRHRHQWTAELLLSEINKFGPRTPADDAASLFLRCWMWPLEMFLHRVYLCVINQLCSICPRKWIKSSFTMQSRREFYSFVISTWQSLSWGEVVGLSWVLLLEQL